MALPARTQHLSPEYPRQAADVSYGIVPDTNDTFRYFGEPTPGAANTATPYLGLVRDTSFSADRGFYSKSLGAQGDPLSVAITSNTTDATIVYTLDGSSPAVEDVDGQLQVINGNIYSRPLVIESTTALRAAAYKPGFLGTNIDTHTYIFPDDVIRQSGDGLPETWGTFPSSSSIDGTPWKVGQDVPSDWSVDQTIVNDPAYRDAIVQSLTSIPTVSLSIDPQDLFGDQGIYVNPLNRGDEWERAVSMEYLDPNSDATFQLNAGVRIHGGASRRPDQTRKHSLRISFRGRYDGNTKLEFPFFAGTPFGNSAADEFDTLILRGSYSDGFTPGDLSWTPINLRDQWARDTQLAMGQMSPHGKYIHLYINGMYWGLYNATERIDGSFVEAYLDGDKDDADVMTDDGLNEGDTVTWNQALGLSRSDLSSRLAYQDMQQLVDIDSLIDYIIVQAYAGNWDWPRNNWLAVRDRVTDGPFHFPVWDVEVGLGASRDDDGHDLERNRTTVRDPGSPAQIYASLRKNEEFRLLFADHLQRHLLNDGPLTPQRAAAIFQDRVDEVFQAIVPETARWGDHNGNGGPTANLPYTRDGEWKQEIDWILNTWFPQRTQIVLDQFRNIGLYPEVDAPVFHVEASAQHGGAIVAGEPLTLHSSGAEDEIWYTLDGADPRLPPRTISDDIYLITPESPVRVLVPSVENGGSELGDRWRQQLDFDDGTAQGWTHGVNGVGFERGGEGEYTDRIQVDVETEMDGVNGSVFIRFPFTISEDALQQIDSLTLRMQYDDGFVAYLNGEEVARDNFRDPVPQWDSFASISADARYYIDFDLSDNVSQLRLGDNLLAIHGLNRNLLNDDMLFLAQLVGSSETTPAMPAPTAMRYDGNPILLDEATPISARALRDGGWSALTEATFAVGVAPGDFNRDTIIDARDIDRLAQAIRKVDDQFDLNGDQSIDRLDLEFLVHETLGTRFGDANLDGRFDDADLLQVFKKGEYEDDMAGNSGWADGDWNGDGEFSSDDVIAALADGLFRPTSA